MGVNEIAGCGLCENLAGGAGEAGHAGFAIPFAAFSLA
jgi:hypothetical protein